MSHWKQHLWSEGPLLFGAQLKRHEQAHAGRETELYEQIRRLKREWEWLKKKLPDTLEARRGESDPTNLAISLRRQCELVG
jgi:hypothetical protein